MFLIGIRISLQHEKFSVHIDSAFRHVAFSPQEEVESDNIAVAQKEAVMKEKGSADVQYYLNVLSTDLKESKGLTTRRTVQSTNNTFHLRTLKIAEKVLPGYPPEGDECTTESAGKCIRMSNHKSVYPSLPHGEHVFALRKLII